MTYIKINHNLYPAEINGVRIDRAWGGRDCKAITLEMDYASALDLFVDDLDWSIVFQGEAFVDDNGETVTPEAEIYDNSDYCVAGPITDNRDGTVTVKMGKPTDKELLDIIMGGK